jgi:hypothetical protein
MADRLAFRSGLAGTVVFSYTDDWFSRWPANRGLGLRVDHVTAAKARFRSVGNIWPRPTSLPRVPKFRSSLPRSAGYFLRNCLESHTAQLSDYEILVDDSSKPTGHSRKILVGASTDQRIVRRAQCRPLRQRRSCASPTTTAARMKTGYYLVNDAEQLRGHGGQFLPRKTRAWRQPGVAWRPARDAHGS